MAIYVDRSWDTFKLLAVDPGIHFMGISVHELDSRTGKYINIDVETLALDRAFSYFGTCSETVTITDKNLMKIRDRIMDLVVDYDVNFLAYESPFYNPTRPGAYGSLCGVVSVLRSAALDANPNILIDCMSPQNIKKGMGAGGTKGKEIMFEKVLGTQELMNVLNADQDDLSEHCIDSIAIGYNARNTILAPMEGWKL